MMCLIVSHFLFDAMRGKVRFANYSNAPIPGQSSGKKRPHGSGGFVLCGDLLRALEVCQQFDKWLHR